MGWLPLQIRKGRKKKKRDDVDPGIVFLTGIEEKKRKKGNGNDEERPTVASAAYFCNQFMRWRGRGKPDRAWVSDRPGKKGEGREGVSYNDAINSVNYSGGGKKKKRAFRPLTAYMRVGGRGKKGGEKRESKKKEELSHNNLIL